MGLEPTTATLATWRSTTELHPQVSQLDYKCGLPKCKSCGLATLRTSFLKCGDYVEHRERPQFAHSALTVCAVGAMGWHPLEFRKAMPCATYFCS